MSRRLDKRGQGKRKILVGIGGINCPCCTIGKKSITKRLWNRHYRRTFKIEMAEKELNDDKVSETI